MAHTRSMRDRVRTYTAYQWAIVAGDGALGGHGSVPIPRPVGLAQPVRHLRLCQSRSHGLSVWEYRAGPLRVVGRSQGTVWSSARAPWWWRVGWHPVAPHPQGCIWRFRAGRRSAHADAGPHTQAGRSNISFMVSSLGRVNPARPSQVVVHVSSLAQNVLQEGKHWHATDKF